MISKEALLERVKTAYAKLKAKPIMNCFARRNSLGELCCCPMYALTQSEGGPTYLMLIRHAAMLLGVNEGWVRGFCIGWDWNTVPTEQETKEGAECGRYLRKHLMEQRQ